MPAIWESFLTPAFLSIPVSYTSQVLLILLSKWVLIPAGAVYFRRQHSDPDSDLDYLLRASLKWLLNYTSSCLSWSLQSIFLFLIFKNIFYLFLERGEERERNMAVWEIHRCIRCLSYPPNCGPLTMPTTQACTLSRNQTSDLLVCRSALSPQSHTNQSSIHFS